MYSIIHVVDKFYHIHVRVLIMYSCITRPLYTLDQTNTGCVPKVSVCKPLNDVAYAILSIQ